MTAEASAELVEFNGQLSLMAVPAVAHDPAAHLVNVDGVHGEVFTRPWVVELILDLVGYTSDRDLATVAIVEPACGTGAFLAARPAFGVAVAVVLERGGHRDQRSHGRAVETSGDVFVAQRSVHSSH